MIPINIVKDHVFNSKSDPDGEYFECKTCNVKIALDTRNVFRILENILNNRYIYCFTYDEDEFDLTCKEIIIKNIIE